MPEIKRRKVEVASVDIQHAVTSVEGVLEVDGSREATVEEKNGRPLADIIKAHHATLRQVRLVQNVHDSTIPSRMHDLPAPVAQPRVSPN